MERKQIYVKLEEIVRDVFEEYDGPVTPELNSSAVPEWDSLANVQFMVFVERAFGIRFRTDEVTGLKNVGELVELIERRMG
jgi:acyl carrier protein